MAIAVAAFAVKMGIGSDSSLSSDMTVFGVSTCVIWLTSAIKDIYVGSRPPYAKEPYIKAGIKLAGIIAAITGINLSVYPKEEVAGNFLQFLKFGVCLAGAGL